MKNSINSITKHSILNIGLTGKYASGKGEVAKILEKLGFTHYSLSDVIREELKKEKKFCSRENMTLKGNMLREQFGPGVLGLKIRELLNEKNTKYNIIDSVRNPFEVKELQKIKNFHLIGVDAPIELRFKRLKKRNREGDVKTLEDMRKAELKENLSKDTNQQLDKTLSLSEIIIVNDTSKKELETKILKIIKNF